MNFLEKFQEAIDVYLQGMEVKSDDFGILYNLGISYLNQFDYSNALKYLLLAQEQNNKSIDLLLTIAVCHAKKRDFDAACHSVDKAKELEGAKCMAGEWICNLYDGTHTEQQLKNLRKVIPASKEGE